MDNNTQEDPTSCSPAHSADRCVCANCQNAAVRSMCLRYSRRNDGRYFLAGYKAATGPQCRVGGVFPEVRAGDVFKACPCSETPGPDDPDVPIAPDEGLDVVTVLIVLIGLAALIFLVWDAFKEESTGFRFRWGEFGAPAGPVDAPGPGARPAGAGTGAPAGGAASAGGGAASPGGGAAGGTGT